MRAAPNMMTAALLLSWILGCAATEAAEPAPIGSVSAKPSAAAAQRLFLRGDYSEAQEMDAHLSPGESTVGAIGTARCLTAVGKENEAVKLLAKAAASTKESTEAGAIAAELAELALERGDLPEADAETKVALRLLPAGARQAGPRWVAAELRRRAGRLDEALAGYKSLVDLYNNEEEIKDPDALRCIGRGAAQYARWKRLSPQFHFLVNEFYPDLLKLAPDYWPAHFEMGLLYLEKYNQGEAAREFKQALAQNPRAAEVRAALAALALENYDLAEAQTLLDQAKEINPRLLWIFQLQADVHLANFEPARAAAALDEAIHLDPTNESTLGRLAAAYVGLDGMPADLAGSRLGRLIDEVTRRNPHAGEFFEAFGDGLDRLRRYPAAARFYQQAIDVMPQRIGPRGKLGLIDMRLGEEVAANKVLREAFTVDPFNVRVNNTLKVLDVLADYSLIESEHFVIKFDRAHDELLARYASKYLEAEVFPSLVKTLGCKPAGKTLIEIFNRSRNTDGHGWFSARMVGLPYIGTVGACAGRMIAIESPNEAQPMFNWARVLRHEFVHVVNLQQTHFNIPHWFTEALAVHNEGYPRPRLWNQLLAERVPKGKIYNLETINTGFIRPTTSDDWAMAYCQAELYAQYMLDRFGPDALAKMLAAYAENLTTPAAIQRSFGVSQQEFEKGYVKRLQQLASELAGLAPRSQPPLKTLEAAHSAAPNDPDAAAALAVAYLRNDEPIKARKLADEVLKSHPGHATASYVLARLKLRAGEQQAAIELLEKCLNRKAPQENVLSLLAGLKAETGDNTAAADLYKLGIEKFPHDGEWLKALARVELKSGDNPALAETLGKLAELNSDDVTMRKKLAELALARKDFPAAIHWARQSLYIDVQDLGTHRVLAEALVGRQEYAPAIEEFEVALKLDPNNPDLEVAVAEACLRADRKPKALELLRAVLSAKPDFPRAAQLKKEAESSKP
jgi:tetratricopeptide (TPR) repeat protein